MIMSGCGSGGRAVVHQIERSTVQFPASPVCMCMCPSVMGMVSPIVLLINRLTLCGSSYHQCVNVNFILIYCIFTISHNIFSPPLL